MTYSGLQPTLLATALLGTERQALVLPSLDTPLGKLISQLRTADQESSLLSAAAVVFLYEQAGRLPLTTDQPLPSLCEPDEVPRCNVRAGLRLRLMLNGQYREVLPEWLAVLASAKQRVPEESLPDLLNLGLTQTALREAIVGVIGKRGDWLAAQNPEWSYVSGSVQEAEAETIWQIGSSAARRLLIKRLRTTQPDLAREWLSSTWKQEKAEDAAAFLSAFQTGLSMADEPFLEEALDNRRKEVRLAAAGLLACLPQSRLVQRMVERVQTFLKVGLSGDRKTYFNLTLPDSCDKAMLRDGIEPKPQYQNSKVGEKGWWVQQMLAAVPPSFWSESWNKAPAVLVKLAYRSEWKEVLLEGWIKATLRHREVEWAEVLFKEHPSAQRENLMQILSVERQEDLILERIQSYGGSIADSHIVALLESSQHQWGIKLVRAVLEGVRLYMAESNNRFNLMYSFKNFGTYISPAFFHEVETSLRPTEAQNWGVWQKAIEEFLALLQFRYEMLKEINP